MGERTGDARRRLVCSGLGEADSIVVLMTVVVMVTVVFVPRSDNDPFQFVIQFACKDREPGILLLLLHRPLPDLTICHTVCEGDAGGK